MKSSDRFVDGLNITEIAYLFNISQPTVGRILNGHAPDGNSDERSKRYKGATILKAIKSYYGAVGDDGDTTLEKERIRLTAAQANRAEMELAVSRGALLPVDDVIRESTKALAAIKAVVMNLPARIAPAVFNQSTSRDVENVAKGIVTSALDQLQADLKAIPDVVASDETASDLDDSGVGPKGEKT